MTLHGENIYVLGTALLVQDTLERNSPSCSFLSLSGHLELGKAIILFFLVQ